MWLLSFIFITLLVCAALATNCSVPGGLEGVCRQGDVIIGGLFPIHQSVTQSTDPLTPSFNRCTQCNAMTLLQLRTMIYAIKQINKSQMLPNISLGYAIYDTCNDASMAIKATLNLMVDQDQTAADYAAPEHISNNKVKAVIGEQSSELSIVVARLLTLPLITQISYDSTSEILSSKLKFPSFVRTVSSDVHQTRAIVELIKLLNWQSVGIVGSDDEYGLYGTEDVSEYLSNFNICENFRIILPAYFYLNNSQTREMVAEVMEKIQNSTAEVIVVFTQLSNVIILLEEVIRQGVKRAWIASDTWSNSNQVASLSGIHTIGEVFGFIWKTQDVPGLNECRQNNTTDCFDDRNHFLTYSTEWNCSNEDITQATSSAEQYTLYLAVQVIGHALNSLLCCDEEKCNSTTNFSPSELLKEVKKVNFTLNGTQVAFDDNGDLSLGYIVLQLVTEDQNTEFRTIGTYDINKGITLPEQLVSENANVTKSSLGCYRNCTPGNELVYSNRSCCKLCRTCQAGQVSSGGGQQCMSCTGNTYASAAQDVCVNKSEGYIHWEDTIGATLVAFASLGLLMTLLIGALLAHHRDTPIVKSTGGPSCFVILLSLGVCFCSTYTFVGKPTATTCRVGLPLYSMGFALCIACIIANLFQIFVAFKFETKVSARLRPLNRPVVIAACLAGIQWTMCVLWAVLMQWKVVSDDRNTTTLLKCDMGSTPMLSTVLGYNAFLCIVCFTFAFKSKRLPDLYKNASFITVGMLIFLVVWILFITMYMYNMNNLSMEPIAILVSNYSLLCCYFSPKCYIILFRKEMNKEKVILEHIRKHCEKKGIPTVISSH